MINDFIAFSLPPILIASFTALACALPGNFLILRKQALIGDAISHVVLPGIVLAFLVSGSISTVPMLLGAAAASLVAVVLIEVIKYFGRIEAGAAMGVVFTSMFALGVLILEQSETRNVHLDVEHVLFGNLESLIWLEADGWESLFTVSDLALLPPELFRMIGVFLVIALFILAFWRPLVLMTFDEYYARTLGIPTFLYGLALVVVTALAAVSAFDAVGSIIVIAMILCPPAAARLMTNSLVAQVWISMGIALASSVIGYIAAGHMPLWIGLSYTVSAAGMIATISGIFLGFAALFGQHRSRVT